GTGAVRAAVRRLPATSATTHPATAAAPARTPAGGGGARTTADLPTSSATSVTTSRVRTQDMAVRSGCLAGSRAGGTRPLTGDPPRAAEPAAPARRRPP